MENEEEKVNDKCNHENNPTLQRSSSEDSLVSEQNDNTNKLRSSSSEVINSEDCSNDDSEKLPSRNLPTLNVPERIVLCIDLAQDPDYTPFKLGHGSKYSPLFMVKRVVEIFMYSKNIMSLEHEFALVVLQADSARWLGTFTNNPRDIISLLEDMNETKPKETFNLSTLFDVIAKNVKVPPVAVNDLAMCLSPAYVLRVILLYSRSFCIPEFKYGRDTFNMLTSSPYFTLDLLYIHEQPTEHNKCEEIFNVLDALDEKGFSYVFDVPRNATKLHDNMAKLLAHPLQRPLQKLAQYKLKDNIDIN